MCIRDRYGPKNTTLPAIPFTVSDAETEPEALALDVASSNEALVFPPEDILITGGSGGAYEMYITPQLEVTGTATITVTVLSLIHI